MQRTDRLQLNFSMLILILITLPVIIHTRSLLLKITQVEAHWILLEVYAWFFALAFDCSIFMFAIFRKREQAIAFAVISGIVGWLFWCGDLVFVDFWLSDANRGELWSRLIMGTLWAGCSSYLVFWCAEIVAEKMNVESIKPTVSKGVKAPAWRRPAMTKIVSPQGFPVKREKPKKAPGRPVEINIPLNGHTDIERAKKLRSEGLSIREIAEHLKVSKSTIGKWNKEQLI